MIYYGCDACPLSDCVICHILSHLQICEYMSRSCSEFGQICTFFHGTQSTLNSAVRSKPVYQSREEGTSYSRRWTLRSGT
jgi:hypothetical protein